MEQLPAADAVFLAMEMPGISAHVGGLTILDPSESPDFSFEKLVRTVDERIRYEPRFTQKLRELPLGLDRPYLVDDPDFDIRDHIHRIGVPAPGGLRELSELVSYLHERPLERDRALWELWFIEGVEGDKCAMFMKSHHCLMDGVAGSSLGELLCDLEPDPPAGQLPPAAAAHAVSAQGEQRSYSDLHIGLRAAVHLVEAPRRLFDFGAGMLRQTAGTLLASRREGAPPLPFDVPATPFNKDVGPRRAFAAASVSLDDVKKVKAHFDVTVNDVILAITGTALRQYLQARDALPEQSLVCLIAVSKREVGDDTLGNQVTMAPCLWASDEPERVERLLQIHRNAEIAKELQADYDADFLAGLGGSVPPGLAHLFFRLLPPDVATALVPGNVLISNVRGTPVPLYVAGARIETMYPLSIIAPSQGLNCTVVSYMGRVDVGFIADPDLVDDVWELTEHVPRALAELLADVEKEQAFLEAATANTLGREVA